MSGKRYEKISFIGEGQFATVYKARDKETNVEVAIKKIKIGNYQEAQDGINRTALREIKLLLELHHENVISLLDVYGKDSSISLVFSLMETDLEQILYEHKIFLNFGHIKSYILMTLKGVEFLHQNYILHRDLKPNNLLLDGHNVLKIADFGLARTFGSPSRIYSHQVVTRWYRAPELLYGSRMYSTGIDIWAIGCILAELFTREALFPGDSDLDTLDKIVTILGTPTEKNWLGVTELPDYVQFNENTQAQPLCERFSACTQDALDLLESMLRLCPSERCDASQALAMPYFTTAPYPTPSEKLPRVKKVKDDDEGESQAETKPLPTATLPTRIKLETGDDEDDEDDEDDDDDNPVGNGVNIKREPAAVSDEMKPTSAVRAKRLKFE